MLMTATVAKLKSTVRGSNSDGPIDNNDDNDCNNEDNDDDNNGGGQDRSANVGLLWRSGRKWR